MKSSRFSAEQVFLAGALTTVLLPSAIRGVKVVWDQAKTIAAAPWRRRVKAAKKAQLETEFQKAKLFSESLSDEDAAAIEAAHTIEEIKALQTNGISAQTILKWYLKKALAAHKKTNCLVAMDVEASIIAAAVVDRYREEHDGELLPLHGIPVSIKDCIGTKGMDATIGIFSNCFDEMEDGPVTAILKKNGAVVIGKTNIPQTMLSFECQNDVFGETSNPYDSTRTPGGSSGGEGALLALRGAVTGIGTDIGGSIRIPCHFCGLYGIKPTQWRLPLRGGRTPVGGQEGVSGVVGPMAQNMDDLVTMFQQLADGEGWKQDGLTLRVPFRQDLFQEGKTKKLRVGFYHCDKFVHAAPACTRAVDEAVAALFEAGHEIVKFEKPDGMKPMTNFYALLGADAGTTVHEALQGDPPNPHVAGLMNLMYIPYPVKRLIAAVLGRFDAVMPQILLSLRMNNVTEYFKLLKERNEHRHDFVDAMRQQNVDIVIAPGLGLPAPTLGTTTKLSFGSAYTAYHNLMDTSVVAVPVTKVDGEKDVWPDDMDTNVINPLMRKAAHALYEPKKMHGLPVGVQIIGHRLSEEFVLGAACQLSAALAASK